MKVTPTPIEGLYILDLFHAQDHRGEFVKTFHANHFKTHGLDADFKESFYSVNHKGVIRGLHFQTPPYHHAKLVYCVHGAINDMILDIRKDSPTYGKSLNIELTSKNYRALYLASGLAHGFESMENHTIMTYHTTIEYQPTHDFGIRFDSFGGKWNTPSPIINQRDLQWPTFDYFDSPF